MRYLRKNQSSEEEPKQMQRSPRRQQTTCGSLEKFWSERTSEYFPQAAGERAYSARLMPSLDCWNQSVQRHTVVCIKAHCSVNTIHQIVSCVYFKGLNCHTALNAVQWTGLSEAFKLEPCNADLALVFRKFYYCELRSAVTWVPGNFEIRSKAIQNLV